MIKTKGTFDRINKTRTSRFILFFYFTIIREKTRPSCTDYNPFILGRSAIVIVQISITFRKWYMVLSV